MTTRPETSAAETPVVTTRSVNQAGSSARRIGILVDQQDNGGLDLRQEGLVLRLNLNTRNYRRIVSGASNRIRAKRACIVTERGTDYEGPVKVSRFVFGAQEVLLARPADPDRLLDDPGVLAWNARDDYMPYWAYLWPGAFLLAEAVAREPWTVGQQALEIGCGLGLAGLVALRRGLNVRFTDYDEAPLRFVQRSVVENGLDPSCSSIGWLDWRDLPPEQYPVILGADVLYERRLVPLVANLIATMLAPGGLALIAGPYRVAAEGFEAALEPLGLTVEARPLEISETELGPLRGTIHRVRRRT